MAGQYLIEEGGRMTITEMVQKLTAGELAGWAVVLLIILFSLIQIAPVKLNPWDGIFGWLGSKLNGKTEAELKALKKQVCDIWISNHRHSILTFARECRDEIKHDSEEWAHILSLADEYESYCRENTVSNGVVKADTEYICSLYQELSRDHKI